MPFFIRILTFFFFLQIKCDPNLGPVRVHSGVRVQISEAEPEAEPNQATEGAEGEEGKIHER